ncbi:MAG TPA: recombinase family protein, partial [Trebonia sp.]
MVTTAAHAGAEAVGIVPMAFIGRTSTVQMQDPVESLAKQLRLSRERLPEGFVITRYFWDVESGGTDLDARSQTGTWRKFAAGIPRDGGMADLRAEIKSGGAAFAGVICENIERAGRDTYDALKLEKELHAAGLMIFATDEPIDAAAPEASTILVRRMKQGMAEYFRYNLKAQMWEGLKQYAISGHNTGPAPYGYTEDRTTHPNPMKAQMGATRARLVPDPERGPWVTRIFEWRVHEKLSLSAIAQRLHAVGAPTRDGRPWTIGAVNSILANPKYTGRIVIGRTRNAGDGKSAGQRKVKAVPREHWTWAADGNEHPALVTMELWEAAQIIGRQRGNVQDHQDQGRNGRPDYPLRARIRCAQCQRRMAAKANPGRAPGKQYYYYTCPHNPANPRDQLKHPQHVRAAIRERVIHTAVNQIITGLLSADRADMLAAILPATAAGHDQRNRKRAEELQRQIHQNETAQHGLITQLERLGSDAAPAADAMRQRITDQFTARYDEAKTLQAELDQIAAEQPAEDDPALLDELPYAAAAFDDAPQDIKAKIYAAFDIQVLYRAPIKQATIWATITPTTPGIITALTTDPRTDHDTAYGHLPTAPIAPPTEHADGHRARKTPNRHTMMAVEQARRRIGRRRRIKPGETRY